jgi:putative peptide zinc metalloprotease protein
MKRLLIASAALVAALGLAAVRPDAALAEGGDTAAVAVNTKDGSSIFKLAFAIKRVAGDVVDNSNAAVAFASCSNCQTVAISIQVVLVTGDPSVVSPENLALALNENCTSCETLASAYQFAFSTDGNVHFTPEGSKAIADIRHQLRELGKSDLTIAEIQARVQELMQQLAVVLSTELVAAGKSGGSHPSETGTTQTQPTPTETTPTVPTETTPTETVETTTTP